jgi:hypothetical protein
MSRIFSCALLTSLTFFLTTSSPLSAADKNPKSHDSTAAAREQVAAALRAEIAGENDRRAELLTTAARSAPDLPEANWHLGRVQVAGKWHTLDEAQQEATNDQQLTEYRKLRGEAADNPKLLRGLARWCEKAELHDLARLHFCQLLARDDIDGETRAEAVKRLDLHNVNGTWITGAELKEREDRSRTVEAALRQWRPRINRLQMLVDGESYVLRDRAVKELTAIDDSQVILVLESLLADAGDRFSEEAVKVLAKFPQLESTHTLTRVAVMSRFSAARDAAVAELKRRPKQDYIPLLLAGLIAPVRLQFSINISQNGAVEYAQAIGMEGPGARYISIQSQMAMPGILHPKAHRISPGAFADGTLVASEVAKATSRAELASTETSLANNQIAESNRRTFDVLEQLSNTQLPRDATQYWNWWQDYNQYYWPKPTYFAYQQRPPSYYVAGIGASCFLAGTEVYTQLGPSRIELIKRGDRVLAQDQDTGELAYKAVLRTTIRPPTKMVYFHAGGDEITTTLGHPFWVDGQGWKMAKELKEGDLLHSLNGAVRVDKIEQAGEERAYNLVVDDFNTYFVGQQGLLVHDNEFRKPTRAIVPGLIEEQVAVANATKK